MVDYTQIDNETLIKMAQQGDEVALNHLFINNEKLISLVINRTKSIKMPYEDKYSLCQEGMFKAYRKFNPQISSKYVTFAYKAMVTEILREYQKYKTHMRGGGKIKVYSLNHKIKKFDNDTEEFLDYIVSKTDDNARVDNKDMLNFILDKCNFTDREKTVLIKHTYEYKTVREIAEELEISRSRIGQILNAVMKKMKNIATTYELSL